MHKSRLYFDRFLSSFLAEGSLSALNYASKIVSVAFRAYGSQILLMPFQTLLVKTLHSMNNTRFPFRVSLVTFMANIILSVALMQWFCVFGIALASTLSRVIGCVILLWYISRHIGLAPEFFNPLNVGKLLLCGIGLFVPQMLIPTFSSAFVTVLISGGMACLIYFGFVLLLFRKELKLCVSAIRK